MSIVSAFLLGLMQGACEFLPISSSGHLALLHAALDEESGGVCFDLFLHLATLLAVTIVCRSEILQAMCGGRSLLCRLTRQKRGALDEGERFATALILSTLPMAAALALEGAIDFVHETPALVGACMAFSGLSLVLTVKKGERGLTCPTASMAVLIGIGQLIAVFPGISRSGMTTVAALLSGMERKAALKYAFLLSIPTVIGANLVKLPKIGSLLPAVEPLPLTIAALTAFLSGLVGAALLNRLKNRSFALFGSYSILVGVGVLLCFSIR